MSNGLPDRPGVGFYLPTRARTIVRVLEREPMADVLKRLKYAFAGLTYADGERTIVDIVTRKQDGITIVEVDGDIDVQTAPQLDDAAMPLVVPDGKMLLDLSRVFYMSSAGLRILMTLCRKSKEVNARLVLMGLSESLQENMTVTGFLKFVEAPRQLRRRFILSPAIEDLLARNKDEKLLYEPNVRSRFL